mgnify:CR=1 FL=1
MEIEKVWGTAEKEETSAWQKKVATLDFWCMNPLIIYYNKYPKSFIIKMGFYSSKF